MDQVDCDTTTTQANNIRVTANRALFVGHYYMKRLQMRQRDSNNKHEKQRENSARSLAQSKELSARHVENYYVWHIFFVSADINIINIYKALIISLHLIRKCNHITVYSFGMKFQYCADIRDFSLHTDTHKKAMKEKEN